MPGPTNRPVRVALVGGLAVLLLGAAGCSGDAGEEGATPVPSSTSASPSASAGGDGEGSASPSASASGSPSGEYEPATSEGPAQNVPVPQMPEAATEPTEEGLEAAVEYWWEVYTFAKSTGDVAPLESVSAADCTYCNHIVDNWPGVYEAGAWVVVQPVKIDTQLVTVEEDKSRGTMLFDLTEEAGTAYLPDGTVDTKASSDAVEDSPWSSAAIYDQDARQWLISDIESMG